MHTSRPSLATTITRTRLSNRVNGNAGGSVDGGFGRPHAGAITANRAATCRPSALAAHPTRDPSRFPTRLAHDPIKERGRASHRKRDPKEKHRCTHSISQFQHLRL